MSGLARFTAPTTESDHPVADDPLAGVAGPLRRFLGSRPRPVAGEACEMCAQPIRDDHRHVVDLDQRAIQCTCRGCALLFDSEAAADGRYRAVPDRYLHVDPFVLTPVQWASLQIPVGVAFVVHNSRLDSTVAFYPSPGGATESELPLTSWQEIVAANPALADVAADVEAVLVRGGGDRPGPGGGSSGSEASCFVVPVDRCYELVGMLRMTWRGFDGGQEARAAMADFFTDVGARARTVAGGAS